ncbi:hypothetical protein CN601_12320 [Bacillus sp. AFS017336]|nr:hypothetical protein CN601_12320 [Bacillus sp. AFS017336]
MKKVLYCMLLYFEVVDWNGRRLDSYGISGKAETPQASPRRLRSRPMESENPVVEINHITLPLHGAYS